MNQSPRCLVRLLVALALVPFVQLAAAQEKSVRPGINQPFENPDVKNFVGIFEGESREIFTKRKEIVAACKLKPEMVVADVGAGTGLFTRLFAKEVGPKGKVYAVDIAPKFIEHVEKTCKDADIKNVIGIVCTADSVKLPPKSVDLVFICDTYHHFEFPFKTMASIHEALRPGGQVVVVDFHRIPGKSREWVLNHVRAGQEVVVKEIEQSGFKKVGEEKLLSENYLIRFEKKRQDNRNEPVLTLPGRVVIKTDGKAVGELLGPTEAVAYSPDGNSLVSVASVPAHMGDLAKQPYPPATTSQLRSASSAVKLWDARTGKELRAELHKFDISLPVFSPDGKRLAFATWPGAEPGRPRPPDSVIKVWEVASGKELLSLKWPKQTVESLAISPDGKRLAAGSGTGAGTRVRVWDAETGKELYMFGGLSGEAFCLGFSPDGKRLAVGTRNFADQAKNGRIVGEVRFWDLTTGQPAATWGPHGQYVRALAYSPDGKRLAVGFLDRAPVKVCDAETGREALKLANQGVTPLDQAQALAFSPDGTRLAAIASEKETAVKVWDAATGKLLSTLPLGDARCIAFAPDGSRLAVGGASGVTIWELGR